ILGLGGLELSAGHAADTAKVISRISPRYMGALTLMVVPGTPVHEWIEKMEFEIPDQAGILTELETMIGNIEVEREMVFRTNHASNYLPLKGTLPGDKARMLELISRAKSGRIALRSEKMRGL
ncbi:radical SAM protein, partial [Thermodesulfobacteriota bacterium]